MPAKQSKPRPNRSRSSRRKSSKRGKRRSSSRPRLYKGRTVSRVRIAPSAKLVEAVARIPSPVVRALALPHESAPIRFSGNYTSTPTATAQPYNIYEADFSLGAGSTTPLIPNGQTFVAAFRNPLRATIHWDPNPNNLTCDYAAMMLDDDGSVKDEVQLYTTKVQSLPVVVFNDKKLGDTGYAHPHGPTLYLGEAEGKWGVWVDADDTKAANFTVYSSTGTFNLYPFKLNGGSWDALPSVASSAGNAVFGTNDSGYYHFQVEPSTSPFSIRAGFICRSGFLCHLPMNGLNEKIGLLQQIRTNAVSLMVTAQASENTKAGTVVGYQVPSGNDWTTFALSGDPVSRIQGSASSVVKILATGMYGFLKPGGTSDFEMVTPIQVNNGRTVRARYSLLPEHHFLVIAAKTGAVANTFPGGDIYVTAAWGVEFCTTDPWFVQIPPSMNPRTFESQIVELRGLEQWHENPLHVSDIMNYLKGASRGVLRYGPSLMKALSLLPTSASKGFGVAGEALDTLGRAIL